MDLRLLTTFCLAGCGHAASQEELAFLYAPPEGASHDAELERNLGKAFYWRARAARNGSRAAQHNLRVMHRNALGLEEHEAPEWLRDRDEPQLPKFPPSDWRPVPVTAREHNPSGSQTSDFVGSD